MAESSIPTEFKREAFDAYMSASNDLLCLLGALQKDCANSGQDWIERLHMIATGMDLHDAGVFPDEWWQERPDQGSV